MTSHHTAPDSALVSAPELANLVGEPEVRIFDVRGTWQTPARALHEDYVAGHVPGAGFLDWTREFIEQDCALNVASVANFEAAKRSFETLGIRDGDAVVIYDDYHHMLAGRVWWAMRYWGFENVQVLDGGWGEWNRHQLPVTVELPAPRRGSFEPRCDSALRVSLEELLQEMQNTERTCHIDGRGADGYAGKADDPRTGHVPGAVNVPFKAMLNEDTGRFLDTAALEEVFNRIVPGWRDARIISSCGSGYAGTVPMLALSQLGVDSALFDGSFAEWKQDPSRAVEQS